MPDGEAIEAGMVTRSIESAQRKVEAATQEKMGGFTAGLQLPPGMKLPF